MDLIKVVKLLHEHLIKYYGERYKLKLGHSYTKIKSAFIEGYRQRHVGVAILDSIVISDKRYNQIKTTPNGFNFVIDDNMNDDLGALLDENGDLIGYINFNGDNALLENGVGKNEKEQHDEQEKFGKSN